MTLQLIYDIPSVTAEIVYRGRTLRLDRVLVDTGSATTVFRRSLAESVGMFKRPTDSELEIRGIGGVERIYQKRLDSLSVGELVVRDFIVDIGKMDYGYDINGIIGSDFLLETQAVIDYSRLEIRPA